MDKIVLKSIKCPLCNSSHVEYHLQRGKYQCKDCHCEWSDFYVKVEYPNHTTYFEQKVIGYPCFNSEDNGACYVPEYEYIKYYGKRPSKDKYFKPVSWPESQEIHG